MILKKANPDDYKYCIGSVNHIVDYAVLSGCLHCNYYEPCKVATYHKDGLYIWEKEPPESTSEQVDIPAQGSRGTNSPGEPQPAGTGKRISNKTDTF